jgi:hypothetical protein
MLLRIYPDGSSPCIWTLLLAEAVRASKVTLTTKPVETNRGYHMLLCCAVTQPTWSCVHVSGIKKQLIYFLFTFSLYPSINEYARGFICSTVHTNTHTHTHKYVGIIKFVYVTRSLSSLSLNTRHYCNCELHNGAKQHHNVSSEQFLITPRLKYVILKQLLSVWH